MHSDERPAARVRPMTKEDRREVAGLIDGVENFNPAEKECALELVDIYLEDPEQTDYAFAVASGGTPGIQAYTCWGPVPLTRGTFDLYWIATRREARGLGFGRALVGHVERAIASSGGRLLVAETSAKSSYRNTIEFYRCLGFEEASHIADFYDVGDDRLIFVKRIS